MNAPALSSRAVQPSPGFGLGLRTPHYTELLTKTASVDWLEVITDNFLVNGGKPLVMLKKFCDVYPIAMHGVGMSIGSSSGLNIEYVKRVKALSDWVNPLWISDHLCWTGNNHQFLHDLYPLPYTDETAKLVIHHISQAQDILQRPLVIENVSSYIDFKHSASSEWQFLSHVLNEADCHLLLDVNNIYVSSVNHGFNPQDYLSGLPAQRIQQIHLAGHSDNGTHIIDTHDHPVAPAVWDLYRSACERFGDVATMIERDDHIPPLNELIAELAIAKTIASEVRQALVSHTAWQTHPVTEVSKRVDSPSLLTVQTQLMQFVLNDAAGEDDAIVPMTNDGAQMAAVNRLGIYHHAYRARLAEVLADVFEKTNLFMGSDTFYDEAVAYAVANPPDTQSLSPFGKQLPDFFKSRYPDNIELHELAQLEWDLRSRFDFADVAAMTQSLATRDSSGLWMSYSRILHPSWLVRPVRSNVVQIWHAIHNDEAVPEVNIQAQPTQLGVWRKGLQPHFKTIDEPQSACLALLQAGHSVLSACGKLAEQDVLPEPERLAQWFAAWLDDEILIANDLPSVSDSLVV
jgi:uncharacterized protein (UPF0276 family)